MFAPVAAIDSEVMLFQRFIAGLFFVVFGMPPLFILGCQQHRAAPQDRSNVTAPASVVPGSVALWIETPTRSGFRDWLYEVTPSSGVVVELPRDAGAREGRGIREQIDCYKRTESVSPDGQFTLHCSKAIPGASVRLWVSTRSSTVAYEAVYDWKPYDPSWRQLESAMWWPNSKAFALITMSEHAGTGLYQRLWAFAGHPVPVNAVYVDIVDLSTQRAYEYLIRADLEYAQAGFLAVPLV